MNNDVSYNFTGANVRTTVIDGEPYFCAADVGKILDLSNVQRQVLRLPKKGTTLSPTLTNGGIQRLIYINESNLYRLIFKSNKEDAIKFQDWIMDEVIPSIRKTGKYDETERRAQRLAGIEVRKTLTDRIDDSGENNRMHGYGYSNYTMLAYKLCDIEYIKQENFRDTLNADQLDRVKNVEDMIKILLTMNKEYKEIKDVLGPIFNTKKEIEIANE